MNSPARETPAAGSALLVAKCPQCLAELRLLQPATATTPISCCQCGTAFYIQAVATAPLSAAPPRPADPTRPPLRLVSPPPPPPAPPPAPAAGRPRRRRPPGRPPGHRPDQRGPAGPDLRRPRHAPAGRAAR